MIALTLTAAALAAANPAQPAPAGPDHSATAPSAARIMTQEEMAGQEAMAKGKMDCCKDGCACCGKKDEAKATPAR